MRLMVRSLAVATAAALACVPSFAAGASGVSVIGTWTGEMRQIDPDRESSYPMTLTIAPKGGKGTTSYPSLNCKGTLTRITETKSGYAIYQEKISNGPDAHCIDGLVLVTADGGKLVLGWFATFEGAPSLASALLTPAAK
ncbi:MAG: hypothetical protein KBA31_00730 [Alphaproteobacteria bacterium]|nr:hypothetical protein [Alphaproteobacteria bacterium]